MKGLVLAEGNDSATLSTIQAALTLQCTVDVVILGTALSSVVEALQGCQGVAKVLVAEHPDLAHPTAEAICATLVPLASQYQYILAPATTFGKNALPRIAASLKVGQISDVISIVSADTFMRPIYAGNAIATVQSLDAIKVMTIRPTAFAPVGKQSTLASVESITACFPARGAKVEEVQTTVSKRPELTAAKRIVSGGRGLQTKENFALIEALADKLEAAIGASRAAVDAGFVPNDYQVGQTGKIVAPQLYIAIGISGAIQHLAGMKDSKVIVAINKDPDAPIFKIATYGLVGDLFQIVPELTAKL